MKYWVATLLLIACVAVVGCSKGPKKPKDLPKLYPLTLTITQDGQPCAEAHVVLSPDPKPDGYGWSHAGVTDAAGTIKIMTNGNWDGCPEGTFLVRVYKEVVLERSDPAPGASEGTPTKIVRTIPQKYNTSSSELRVSVKAGENVETLEIGPAVEENVPVAG